MNKVCVIFNPLELISFRGIPKYTIETREMLLAAGATVHTLKVPKFVGRSPRALQVVLFMFYQQLVLPVYAITKRPAVIFDAYNSYSVLGAFFWRYVYVIHDFIPFSNRRWWLRPGSIYQRFLHKVSRFFPRLELCYINEVVAMEGQGLVAKFDGLIPNVVRPLRKTKEDNPEAQSLVQDLREARPGWPIVTTISGGGSNKDFDGLLRLLAATRKQVVVVAFGLQQRERSMVPNSLDVVFPGVVTSEYIGTAIAKSDLFVFHSLQEGFGRPVIEALMEGVKVLSVSHVPVIRAVMEPLLPLLYLYDDINDFPVRFHEALLADNPGVVISGFEVDEERKIANRILNGK
jgi:hypothetical protein